MSLLTGTLDVDYTARAKLRAPGIAADIASQMPAPHALGLGAGFDLDPYPGFTGRNSRRRRGIGLNDVRLAGNQQKSQFVPQSLESSGLGGRRVNQVLRLERRADRTGRSQALEIPRNICVERNQCGPIDYC